MGDAAEEASAPAPAPAPEEEESEMTSPAARARAQSLAMQFDQAMDPDTAVGAFLTTTRHLHTPERSRGAKGERLASPAVQRRKEERRRVAERERVEAWQAQKREAMLAAERQTAKQVRWLQCWAWCISSRTLVCAGN
jgi:hypothetical protein